MAIDKDIVLRTVLDLFDRSEKHSEYIRSDREAALRYYYGTSPAPPDDQRSGHISMDVYDSIESLKAKILTMLTANQSMVKFTAKTPEDEDTAQLATEYVNDMMMRRNEGYLILHDAIFDGLLMRMGVVRVDWEDDEKTVEQTVDGVPPEAEGLLTQQGWEIQDVEQSETQPGLVNITVTRQQPNNRVKIECIPPEHLLVIEDPADNDEPDFICERCAIPTGDLLNEYDADDVERLQYYQYEELELMRIQYADHTSTLTESEVLESRREREVYKAYIRADFETDNEMRLYEVIFGRNVLLDCNEVDFCPYLYWSPIRISHRTIGRAISDVTRNIQTAKTALRRGILDNVVQGNMPRTLVNESLVNNMAEVMDHSVGGVIGVSDIGRAVMPLPPAQMPQGAILALETLEQEKQARTGFSSLAQGMNPDAISQQNARATIEMYAKMGAQRPAQIARLFAEKLLKPLMRRIFELGVKHENIDVMLKMDARTISANPGAWFNADMDLEIAVALTEDEQVAEAMQLLSLHQVMAADPANSHIYQDKNRAATLGRVAELLNLSKDILITGVENPEYQQSKQKENEMQQMMVMLQQQQAQAQMQLAQMQLQLQNLIADRDFQVKQAELKLKASEQQHDAGIDESEIDIKRKELVLKAQETAIESSLEQSQQRPVAIG